MCLKLLALFIVVPLVELFLLIRLGDLIGFWPTVAVVVVTGMVGAALAKHEGLTVLREIQGELGEGRMPAGQLLDGLLILAAGLVLLTPGLITDTLGFVLLIPYTRGKVRDHLKGRFQQRVERKQNIYTVHLDEE